MKDHHRKNSASVTILGNVALILLGFGIALGLAEMLMRAFPNWVPPLVRVNPPARRVKAFIDETYDLRKSDGDLFHHMLGNIVPLSPDQDQVVAQVHMVTDANGFRNSPPEKNTYGIVALGDSFTRASGVAAPWPQKLAEYTGMDVLNLADVGFGPQDELNVLRQYGLKKKPAWVIMAYFEGNDLYDAGSYEQANPFISLRFGRYILDQSIESWRERKSGGTRTELVPNYRYPITITINGNELEMVFFPSYISWLSLSREEIAESQNYQLVQKTILEVQKLSTATGANFLLVYMPSKSHVYLPHLNDPEVTARIFVKVQGIEQDNAGFLQFTNNSVTPELIHQHIDNQSILLAGFTAKQNISFLDLTPTFQKVAGEGAELYYPYDTHWNQLGHDLASETIYNYLKERHPATEQDPGYSK